MLSVLNVRANNHNSCEDNVAVQENDNYVWGVICDGCSTGIKSYFASQTIAYFIDNQQCEDATCDDVITRLKNFLSGVKIMFQFSHMNLLSTCILFSYNKQTKTLKIRALGDGYYYVNGNHNNEQGLTEHYFDQGNIPDYIGYHLDETDSMFQQYLNTYPEFTHENVDRFMICSDGIKAIERSQFAPETTVDKSILFDAPISTNYLIRMWNTLKRTQYTLSDDLTIVSYVENS